MTATTLPALLWRRLKWVVLVASVLIAIATVGFVVFAEYGWFDALYMSVITLGAIGYSEVEPLDTAGRIWAMLVIFAGFALLAYAAASLTSLFLSGEMRATLKSRRRTKMREHLQDHLIVVGFGRVGQASVAAARQEGRTVAVIEINPTLADEAAAAGAVFVEGDARGMTALMGAHIERAKALVTAADDPTNLVVVLTARTLRPDLRVVSRVNDREWRDRLLRAGAAQVVPVYESVGMSLAATALDADVLAVQDLPALGVRTEELVVGPGSNAAGRDLVELMQADAEVLILGVRREAGLTRWHEVAGPVEVGDVLVALGPAAALRRLSRLVAAPGTTPTLAVSDPSS